jgi:type VI protein secretion system component VasF
MLGFRGRFRDDPEKLKAEFVDPARRALKRSLNRKMEEPRKRVPPSNVPPLRARDRFQRMVLAWLLTVVPLVIAVAAVYLLRNR